MQRGCHCIIGKDYPKPIVDHADVSIGNMSKIHDAYLANKRADASATAGGGGDNGNDRGGGNSSSAWGKAAVAAAAAAAAPIVAAVAVAAVVGTGRPVREAVVDGLPSPVPPVTRTIVK